MTDAGVTVQTEAERRDAYATFSTRPVARTVELSCGLIVDLDEDGVLVGIEVLSADQPFNLPT